MAIIFPEGGGVAVILIHIERVECYMASDILNTEVRLFLT